MNAKYLDMEDWTLHCQKLAAMQGWQLIDNDQLGNGSIEIRCLDNDIDLARLADRSQHVQSDEVAVAAMKAAFLRKEDHAVTAWVIIKYNSPLEFSMWAMESWKTQRQVA